MSRRLRTRVNECKHVKYGWKMVEIEYEALKMIVNGQKWARMSVDDWEWLEIVNASGDSRTRARSC